MPLTKEQLLMPRVLVIGGKEGEPNDTSGDFISGDILTQTVKSIHKWRSEKLKHSVYLDPKYIEYFPHLFKPLQWWEYRRPEEMPEYVKSQETGRVYKRHKTASYHGFGPATREEYEEYLKQKEAQW